MAFFINENRNMLNSLVRALFISCFILILLMNTSCAKQEQATMEVRPPDWVEVKVVYLNFEGGFYGLVTKNGKKLLPMNLAKEYRIEDTILKIKADKVEGLVTIQQWGVPYKLTDVKLIKLGKKKHPNKY